MFLLPSMDLECDTGVGRVKNHPALLPRVLKSRDFGIKQTWVKMVFLPTTFPSNPTVLACFLGSAKVWQVTVVDKMTAPAKMLQTGFAPMVTLWL